MRCISVCALAIGLSASATQAQDLFSLKYGTTLRVTESTWTREGRLGLLTRDSLHLIGRYGETAAIPLQSVTRVERQRARNRLGGAAVGALVGSAIVTPFIVFGCAVDVQACRRDSLVSPHASYARGLGTGAIEGVAVGTLIGGLIGAFNPGTTWSPVRVGRVTTVRLVPNSRSGMTVALSTAR